MSPTRTFGLAAAVASVLATAAAAQLPSDLRASMLSRDSAVARADAPTWDRLTDETFTVVQAGGVMMTKAERLAELRTQTPSALVAFQREQITQYGDVWVRRYLAADLWILEVWTRRATGWRAVAVQVTTVTR